MYERACMLCSSLYLQTKEQETQTRTIAFHELHIVNINIYIYGYILSCVCGVLVSTNQPYIHTLDRIAWKLYYVLNNWMLFNSTVFRNKVMMTMCAPIGMCGILWCSHFCGSDRDYIHILYIDRLCVPNRYIFLDITKMFYFFLEISIFPHINSKQFRIIDMFLFQYFLNIQI